MQVGALIGLSLRTSGILGVGQTALAQDLADAQQMLTLLLQQWRQKRWLVFRLNYAMIPLVSGKGVYTVGPTSGTPPDFVTDGNFRPANVQSCYLRQQVGSGPNSYPVDFPMHIMGSRQEYDQIALKSLHSWPTSIFYDPVVPVAQLYIWPVPLQTMFSLYIAWQQAIDFASEGAQTVELESVLPAETQMALMYHLAVLLTVNYMLPQNQVLEAAARSAVNVMRQTNYAMQPLHMPPGLVGTGVRMKNPAGGFTYPETSASIPVGTTLG